MYDQNRSSDFSERPQQNSYVKERWGNNNHQDNNGYNNQGNNQYRNNNFRGNYQNRGPSNRPPYNGNNYQRNNQPQEVLSKIYKSYAVIGNKDTPDDIIKQMVAFAKELDEQSFVCRISVAQGPDKEVCEAVKNKEVILPWKGFNEVQDGDSFTSPSAKAITRLTQPGYDDMKPGLQLILGKNVRLLLGKECKSPVAFVIGWSKDGAERLSQKTPDTGGMGHILSIAQSACIPVFNLGKPDALQRLKTFIGFNSNEQETKYRSPPVDQSHRYQDQEPRVERKSIDADGYGQGNSRSIDDDYDFS